MKNNSIRHLLAAFRGKRILVVGDVMLDEYLWGEVQRISPEAPVPVVELKLRTCRPGGAANTAANLTALGGVALLGGVVGHDRPADHLLEVLCEAGVQTNGLMTEEGRPTTVKTRIIAHQQQIARVDAERSDPLSVRTEDALLHWVEMNLPQADACILSDYAKGVGSVRFTEQFLRLVRQAGRPVVVDPKGGDYSKYRGATVVKPNLHEVECALRREVRVDADLVEASQQLLSILDGSALLVTRGPQGMTLFRAGARPLHMPAVAREVFDVTGAGDTVTAVLALALAAAAPLTRAARLANQAASIVVRKVGTATVTWDELCARSTRTPGTLANVSPSARFLAKPLARPAPQ